MSHPPSVRSAHEGWRAHERGTHTLVSACEHSGPIAGDPVRSPMIPSAYVLGKILGFCRRTQLIDAELTKGNKEHARPISKKLGNVCELQDILLVNDVSHLDHNILTSKSQHLRKGQGFGSAPPRCFWLPDTYRCHVS
jgi:hypothetical protein